MASDELFFPLSIELVLGFLSMLLLFLSIRTTNYSTEDQSGFLPRCSAASQTLQWSVVLLDICNLLIVLFTMITIFLSLRGGVFEPSKRKYVPTCMYGVTSTIIALFILTLICAVFIWGLRQLRGCTREILLIELAVILDICLFSFYFLLLLTAFDPSGRKRYEELDKYSKVWWKRLRILCCGCCRTRGGDYKEDTETHAFNAAASILAQCFRAYDVVPSDIAAGVLLLHGYQSLSLRSHALQVTQSIGISPATPGISSRKSFFYVDDCDRRERLTLQSARSPPLTHEERELLHMFRQYSRFYLASYGLLLRNYTHCCLGNCEVLGHDPLTCCRKHPGQHYGKCFSCDLTTAVLVAKLKEEDILVSHWEADIFKPVYYVAYDRETNAIVVAIRGTTSLADCVTDISALPTIIPLCCTPKGSSSEDYFVHGGMYESAKYVLESILEHGIISQLVDSSSSKNTCKLIILGHSLGAGVALILSILIWSSYRELRSRIFCLAYSPPGGLLSEATLEYCSSFTCGCFCGQDMITRLAQHTFDRFREELFDVLTASKYPKAFLFLNCFRTTRLALPFHPGSSHALPEGISSEALAFREKLRLSAVNPGYEPKKLYPCKRLIHLRKMVERKSRKNRFFTHKEDIYVPVLEGPEDVQALIASPTMFSDHFPDFLMDVLHDVCKRLESGELDQYFASNELGLESPAADGSRVHEPLAIKVAIPGLTGSV